VQSAITTNYRALSDISESVYLNKLSVMLFIRETVGTSVEKEIDRIADFIKSSRQQISLS
jgi:hypothetical protein